MILTAEVPHTNAISNNNVAILPWYNLFMIYLRILLIVNFLLIYSWCFSRVVSVETERPWVSSLLIYYSKLLTLKIFLEKGEKYFPKFPIPKSHYLFEFYLTVIQFHHLYLQIFFLKHRSVGINHFGSWN